VTLLPRAVQSRAVVAHKAILPPDISNNQKRIRIVFGCVSFVLAAGDASTPDIHVGSHPSGSHDLALAPTAPSRRSTSAGPLFYLTGHPLICHPKGYGLLQAKGK